MTARPIRRNAQTPDRNGKIFYTSTTSLSHISKDTGIIWRSLLAGFIVALGGGLVGEAIFGTILAPKKEDVIIFLLLYLCAVVVFCTGLILSKGTGDKVSAEREEKPGPEKSPENNE